MGDVSVAVRVGAVLAAAVAAAALVVAVPRGQDRDPAAGPARCGGHAAPELPAPGLRPQSSVRGSLGRDDAAVTAVLAAGWEALRHADGPGAPLDPGTAYVRQVERTADGWLVGVVGANGSGREARYGRDAVVAGPDLDHLRAQVAPRAYEGTGGLPFPAPGPGPDLLCRPAALA